MHNPLSDLHHTNTIQFYINLKHVIQKAFWYTKLCMLSITHVQAIYMWLISWDDFEEITDDQSL